MHTPSFSRFPGRVYTSLYLGTGDCLQRATGIWFDKLYIPWAAAKSPLACAGNLHVA